jgi:branched-chain amino acid transport system ATP-binding protein
MLSVSNLTVKYGQRRVLSAVSLSVDSSKLTALVGPNGSGKSTLVSTIMGWTTPASGIVEFNGKRMNELTTHERVRFGLACVPEGRRLFRDLTILDNLDMGAFVNAVRNQRRKTLSVLFEKFPILARKKNQLARTLSGGEQQMLAIARALMSRPKLLMLDEPSLGLEPKTAIKVFDVINELVDEGLACFLVQQNAEQALRMANEAFVLRNGTIVLHGTGAALLKEPRMRFLGR